MERLFAPVHEAEVPVTAPVKEIVRPVARARAVVAAPPALELPAYKCVWPEEAAPISDRDQDTAAEPSKFLAVLPIVRALGVVRIVAVAALPVQASAVVAGPPAVAEPAYKCVWLPSATVDDVVPVGNASIGTEPTR